MVFGRTAAFSILRGAKAHNGGFQHLIAHSSRSRVYSPTSASRDWTRLALRRPFGFHCSFHEDENSGKDQEGDVVASNGGVKKVHKLFVLPCHQNGGLTLTDLKAEIAKVLGSYDLADKFSYGSFINDKANCITAALTEDQVELIKKSLKVIAVMDSGGVKLM
ncbi:hypothetical protein QQ045_029469 [Rhodiola kirilowii]